jgi:ribosomal RNA-processing protein 9
MFLHQVNCSPFSFFTESVEAHINIPSTPPGSWDGDIRIWKLDSKLKSFSLMGTVPTPGVVNSLQLLPIPKGALDGASWVSQPSSSSNAETTSNGKITLTEKTSTAVDTTVKITGIQTLLLVAGLGQEHRLGRWLNLKGKGAVNSTVVMAFHPRT